LAAAVLLVSAWFFAGDRGVVVIAAGMGFGWMVRHLTPRHGAAVEAVSAPADDITQRLQVLEAKTSSLRHDLRGILSPALLTAERLLGHDDPGIRRAGEMMVKTVERATDRLAETKTQPR
jgi:hypothetical protein